MCAVAWHVIAMVCEQQCSVAGIKPKPAHNTHSENYTCLYGDRHAHTAADTYAYTRSHTHTHTQAGSGRVGFSVNDMA